MRNRDKKLITLAAMGTVLVSAFATGCNKNNQESVVPPGTKLDPSRAANEAAMPTPDIRQPKGKGKIQPPRVSGE